jgi:hypothetical protein
MRGACAATLIKSPLDGDREPPCSKQRREVEEQEHVACNIPCLRLKGLDSKNHEFQKLFANYLGLNLLLASYLLGFQIY